MIGDVFGVSRMTVHRRILRVSAVLKRAICRYVHLDNDQQTDQTKRTFFSFAHFPGAVGCIDCTHIRIQAPSVTEGEFVNRKGYHSINVQLICDADLKIINSVIKLPGSVHDARILRQSAVYQAFEEEQAPLAGHLLGDSSYMLR